MPNSDALTTEEINLQELRRRARRRLVGAIALALLAVVVLPMLFDPEPKPLGPEVDIRIPDQSTPFESEMTAAEAQPPEVEPPSAAPPAGEQAPVEAPPVSAAPAASSAPSVAPLRQPAPRPDAPSRPAATKPTPQAAAAKNPAPADAPSAARGYFLQLGAFTNETYAQKLADKARAAGFKPVVLQRAASGQMRVRIGPYAERKQALEVQARLRAKGFDSILLGPTADERT